MRTEDKELLLKDICARLPYGVKCTTKSSWNGIYTIEGYKDNRVFLDCPVYDEGDDEWMIESIVPYLRPLSSMTEEERKELQKITNNNFYASSNYISNSNSSLDGEWHASYNNFVTNAVCNKLISWLDKKHFDHRTDEEGKTLIEKGLAIGVTPENNPYKV